ncbi:TIGR02391 family protein [Curtobacterium flaccumfaciens pv. flaccumfaciens]|uniref:TIGR02391 family protein n=1 Tax=Curtobacterium poinsettiae TaxID=159612 RepID=UPI00217F09C1|nr:TIGR02391 family protein [Curtobacterium flaccumfaciens]MCS6576381.1 TIGR02391 family protein [Curtobacterium flaccumfaciens pv. flaccumfaciens]
MASKERRGWSAADIVGTARARARMHNGTSTRSLTSMQAPTVEQFVADAIGWLLARGLIGPTAEAQHGPYWMVTSEGRAAAERDSATHIEASMRLHADLHPLLDASARPNFERGDYATAVFAATHQVEIAVREAAGLPDDKLGVHLMRETFKPGGVLADDEVVEPEQNAIRDLFVGTIGAFKNPTSHRSVEFDSPIEAASIIHLADLLLRIVDRAKARRANEVSGE